MLDQNGNLKSVALEGQRQLALAQGSSVWQPLSVSYMRGQFNSQYTKDNNITFTQQIPFAGVQKIQTQIGNNQAAFSSEELNLQKCIYKRQLDLQLELIRKQQKELQLQMFQDSVYRLLEQKMLLRLELGEVSKMDYLLVHSKTARSSAQLKQLQQTLVFAWMQLYTLMSYSGPAFELAQEDPIDIQKLPLAPSIENHPLLEQYELNAQKIKFDMQLNKAQQIPQVALGYFNQTLVGIQNVAGQDIYYGPNKRFQGALVQTQIPIDFKAFQQRKVALDLALKQNELQQKQQFQQFNLEQKQLYDQIIALSAAYSDFKLTIDTELEQLHTDAALQLESGQISLLDFIQLQDHKMTLEQELLQWKHELKNLFIQYNWYSNENK